jgi:hypothetical protein
VWGPPGAPTRRRGSGPLITLIVVLSVLLCGGAGIAFYVATRGNHSAAGSGTGGQDQPSGTASSAIPSGVPNDAITAKVGDCMANQGSNEAPRLRRVPCGPGVFEVLQRIEATSDVKRCDGVAGYTHNYFYKTSSEDTSFVLCMRQR